MATNWNNPEEVLKKRQQAIDAGYKSKDVDTFIAKKRALNQAVQAVQGGGLKVTDLPGDQRAEVAATIQASGGKIPQAKSADQIKQEQKYGDVIKTLDLLQGKYGQVEGKGRGAGDLALFASKLTGGAIDPNTTEYEALRKSMIGPLARTISGEVGVLTDKDISRAEGLLPKVNESPRVAQDKLNQLRKLIEVKGGPKATLTPTSPDSKKTTGNVLTDTLKGNPITNFLLGSAVNVAQDVGAGARTRLEQGNLDTQGQQAAVLEKAASQTDDPQRKKDLLQSANNLRTNISNEANNASQSFSEDVNKNPLGRSLIAASQIASTAELPAAVKGVVTKTKSIIDILKNPLKVAGAKRDAAIAAADAKGASFEGDKIIGALEKAGLKISPADKPKFDAFLDTARQVYGGKKLTTKQLVDINSAANSAYTQAGKVGKTAKAVFNKELGDILKTGLRENTPDVARSNELFSKIYGAKKISQKIPGAVVGGATTAAGYALIDKLRGR